MTEELSEREREILALEARWPQHSGAKEQVIRVDLEIAPARYYQLLGRLILTERALAHDPMLVRRLRRREEQSAERRVARSAGYRG